jgi:M6 family metalloprotease-like protein
MKFKRIKLIAIEALIIFSFAIPASASYSPVAGDLVKGSRPAVYLVSSDGKRLAFPNESTYFSWYSDFNDVKIISDSDLAALTLGGLVTVRPGANIVKIQSSPKVYAVAHGGVLRWLTSEGIAKIIYGSDWSKKIIVVPDAFAVSYSIGTDIDATGEYWWMQERDASPTIITDRDASKAPNPTVTTPIANAPAAVTPTVKNVLFILWDPKRPEDPAPDKNAFERVLFGAAPSVADYYKTESNNHVTVVNAGILGWYTADKPPDYYWSDDPLIHASDGFNAGATERLAEAVKKADADFNFKKYDANNDGKLTPDELSVFVVIPQSGDPVDDIANLYSADNPAQVPMTVDGVTLSTVGELYVGNPLGDKPEFGAIAHCLAKQVFGLSDIAVSDGNPYSIGSFSLMSDPHTDLQIDPYTRIQLGWLTPTVIKKVQEEVNEQLPSIEDSHTVIRVDRDQPNGPSLGTEYFLIENRERGYYDNSLPDTGIAVWDVSGSTVNLIRLDPTTPVNDENALWHKTASSATNTARELYWSSDSVRSGVRLLNLTTPDPVMVFTLEKKILTDLDLEPLPSPIQ